MKKIDKFLDELQGLKKKGYDKKKIDALTEGVNLIAAEYRRRKAKADARKKAMVEAAGFAKLDQQREASGLSTKTFIEGVGKTIIECNKPDDVKTKLMDTLGKYASLMESADTIATRCIRIETMMNDDKVRARQRFRVCVTAQRMDQRCMCRATGTPSRNSYSCMRGRYG